MTAYDREIESLVAHKHKLEAEIDRLRIIVADYHDLQHRANAINDENERLRTALETAIDLLCGGRSGHIGGSQPDCEWDSRKDRLLKDVAKIANEQSTEREYDPNVAPCDDAEFGMKP